MPLLQNFEIFKSEELRVRKLRVVHERHLAKK